MSDSPYTTFREPVTVPQFDTLKKNGTVVLRIPLGTDGRGRPKDFAIGPRLARAIVTHMDLVEDFAKRY